MSEIKKSQVYHLVHPTMEWEAHALVLDRVGNSIRVMILQGDVVNATVVPNYAFGSEYARIQGKFCDFIMSSACALKKTERNEVLERCFKRDFTEARRHPTTGPSTSPCRGTGTSRIHEDGPSSSDMGGTCARAICRRLALRLPFRLRQVARAFSFGR